MSKFSSTLKQLRISNNLTQLQLADKLGLAYSTISMYERGQREPDFETLEKIADFFNTSIDLLIGKNMNVLPLYDNIRRRRMELKISQEELSDKIKIFNSFDIDRIERGEIALTKNQIVIFAKALEIHPGTLAGWTKDENTATWRYRDPRSDKILYNFDNASEDLPLPFDTVRATDVPYALFHGDGEITEGMQAELQSYINHIKNRPHSEENGLSDIEKFDKSLIRRLSSLSPDELARVDAFVQGLIANREA